MSDNKIKQLAEKLSKANVKDDGVSFKGESLVLNSEKDCDEVVDAINSCKDLQYLNLEGNTLGVEASKAISKALESKSELKRALWMDMFTGRLKEEIPRALENLGNGLTLAGAQLTELDLSDNAFGPIGVEGLAGLLSSKACYQLEVLKLNNNGLGISGGKILADALLQCHKNSSREGKSLALRLFVAGRNRLENKGAAKLAKVFETLGTLEEIVMPQNGIFHEGIKALSDSLKRNPNLKVLNLNDNIITKKGAKHIASALPHLQQLKILNLGDCLLKTSGATLLADALAEKHEHLEELDLGCNEIRPDGGLAIVNAISNKNKLKQLNINGNIFGSDGRKLLKEELERNKRIGTLGDLKDDESCDEDDESCEEDDDVDEGDESDEGDEGDDKDNENEEEEKEKDSFLQVTENGRSELNFIGVKSFLKNEPLDNLTNILDGMSIKAKPVGALKTFLESPTIKNFLDLNEDKIYEFIKNNEDSSVDFYIDIFIPILIKISSLFYSNNHEAAKRCSEISRKMYKDLFTWASDNNQLAGINNALFVHLGLIKSEDKSFKVHSNVDGSLAALKLCILEGRVPAATENILKCFLEKKVKKQSREEITIT